MQDTSGEQSTWQGCLRDEWKELSLRIIKLAQFLAGDRSDGLSKEDRDLLCQQLQAMRDYFRVLDIRVKRLAPNAL